MSHPHVLIDGTWVDLLYPSADLKHSTGFFIEEKAEGSPSPSGDLRASVSLACPRDLQESWMLGGKSFRIYSHDGGLIWGGITGNDVDRSDGRVTLYAEGIGSALADWDALYVPVSSEEPSFIPNDAVDYAATQGAPFSRYGVDLGSTPIILDNVGPLTDILTLLTRAAILQGKRVHVDSRGAITYRSNPTTPTWSMTPQPDYFGISDDQYLSLLRGYYLTYDESMFTVKVINGATGGTFTLSGNGATTATIAYNASAATVQTAVRTLGGVFAGATVTLLTTSQWRIVLTVGGATLTANGAALTGGTNPGVAVDMIQGDGIVKWEDTAAAAKFRKKQRSIDLTPLGPITSATAQSYIDGRGALIGGRMGWTTQVTLTDNNLFHAPTGLFASPRHVKAGDMLQIPGVIDTRSNPVNRGAIQWVIQEVEVTEGPQPTALVTPVGFVARDFDGILSPPEKPAEKEAA